MNSSTCQFSSPTPIPHYKPMATISCHTNQSSYHIETIFVPYTYRCYMWNILRIGFMASEEISFENVDDYRQRRRTDDGCLPIRLYTISSHMRLRLWWAKKTRNCCNNSNTWTVGFYHTVISPKGYQPRHDKTCLQEFPTRPDTNRPAQPQKLARVLKFRL